LEQTLNQLSTDPSHAPYRVYDRSQDVIETAPDMGIDSYTELFNAVRPHVAALRQKLLLTLKAKAQNRYVPDENGHRLNRKRLHTLCLDLQSQPFQSKAEGLSNETSICLVVDLSGSMRGERIRLAQECAVVLSESMTQLNLPVEVMGFTTRYDKSHLQRLRRTENIDPTEIENRFARFIPIRYVIFKGFNEPFRACRGRFASMAATHYTPLNEAILFSGRRLLETKTRKKMMVVLTDGVCFLGSDKTKAIAQANLVHNLDLLEKAGVEVIAIGIKAPYVREVFQQSIVIENLRELPRLFFELISRKLMGRI
jgi:cobalamin biosynthesis protein CobT